MKPNSQWTQCWIMKLQTKSQLQKRQKEKQPKETRVNLPNPRSNSWYQDNLIENKLIKNM